jgi:flagellar motor component MotA
MFNFASKLESKAKVEKRLMQVANQTIIDMDNGIARHPMTDVPAS